MKRLHFFSSPIIGIDIQKHALRLVKLRKRKNYFFVEQAVSVDLPQGIFSEGKVRNWNELQRILSELVQARQLQGLNAVINLPASLTRMQQLQMPVRLSEAAIEAEIHAQLERDFPGLKEFLYIDYHVSSQSKHEQDLIFFIAARQEYLVQLTECLNNAGLKTSAIDVDIYSIKRLFENANDTTSGIQALICHCQEAVYFIIHECREIIFYQHWECTDTISLPAQLKNKLKLFDAAFPNKRIQGLKFFNVDQNIQGIFEQHNAGQELETSLFDPFSRFKSNDADYVLPHYFPALGAALREDTAW